MFYVTIHHNDRTLSIVCGKETALPKLLADAGIPLDMPCAGNGTCGKCRVTASGQLSPFTAQEILLLTPQEREHGVRLACEATVRGDCTVTLPNQPVMDTIVFKGHMPPVTPNPPSRNWGVAVDVGTTTVAAYLYRLADCRGLQYACMKNPQSAYGADVISRIEQAMAGNRKELSTQICNCVDNLVLALAKKAGIACSAIDNLVITGNTAMLYLLTQQDTECLAHAPFVPNRLFAEYMDGKEIGLTAVPNAKVYLPRCISAFVGADITTAILASGMAEKGCAMLLDIGTNGEIVLRTHGRLLCCSAAAGPALEGAGLCMGMSALPGAIDSVTLTEDGIAYTTVGHAPAVGICGSGIIDAVAVLLQAGILDETGRILEEEGSAFSCLCKVDGRPAFQFANSRVVLTQQDIRNIQLAKGALCAGMLTLLEEASLSFEDVERLYIAGGFGSFMNIQNAAIIGLLPKQLTNKAVAVGNAAGMGACMLLQNTDLREYSQSLAEKAVTVSLSQSKQFNDYYMDCISFGELN